MDVLSEKERAEKENKELVERLNEQNARLNEQLATVTAQALQKEGEGEGGEREGVAVGG